MDVYEYVGREALRDVIGTAVGSRCVDRNDGSRACLMRAARRLT